MPAIDYSNLTPAEKLALIGEIWDSIEADAVPLTRAQAAEIERRLETLDEDIKHGIDADALEAELDRRFP
ncbi:addiction module protein [Nitrospirillum iridis]|uniref:Putative addiction module component (TIGR02574 family) n=1 Tax=Nitrospirillum iridis TaxID=765888 RepID=A0A7X0ATE0_9PROT|nr:addiction module protein [Nitrospirillum iridis]MBB6249740.1 putative addiction module component (TIGR02574 family) [Nitrospirillum iridis]